MNVLLLGATGTLGTALAKKWMAETDYRLTLFSRHAEDVYSENERVAVVNGDANDYVLTFRGEPAKGYIRTISSVVHLIMWEGKNLYFRQSVGITRDMR